MRADPQFFIMGAVCSDEGELCVLDYDQCPEPGIREMRRVLDTIVQEPGNLGAVMEGLEIKAYDKPKVTIAGTDRAWPSVIGPRSSHPPLIVHQHVADALNAKEFSGFALKEVHISRLFPLQLLFSKRPRYFALETEKRIEYFLKIYERRKGDYIFHYETRDFSDPELKKSKPSMAVFPTAKFPSLNRGMVRTFSTWVSGKVCSASWDAAASFWI